MVLAEPHEGETLHRLVRQEPDSRDHHQQVAGPRATVERVASGQYQCHEHQAGDHAKTARISPTGAPPPSSSTTPVRVTAWASTFGSSSTRLRRSASAIRTGRTRGAPSSALSAKARPSARATA